MPDSPAPSLDAIRADLAFFTRRWAELAAPARIELRALGEGAAPQSGFFAPDRLDEAAEWAASLNRLGRNLYMARNPLRGDLAKPASDGDALGAFFVWADCDDAASVAAVRSYGGPGHVATVLTGRTPALRAHLYWELEEPCLNLDAWREVQRGIAARFGSDPAVINPSRIMRLAGTVSWPNAKKSAKGYVPEFVGMKTEFEDDRDPVPFERLRAEFPPGVVRAAAPAEGGAALDRAMATAEIRAGRNWHENVVRLVASYVSRGLGDDEIHAITDGFTTAGYTVADTRREVQTAIDGARRKFKPRPPRAERRPEPSAPSPDADAPKPSPESDDVVRACLGQPLNDYGNGQRLKAHFGADLLFVARMGWFSWDGVRWRQDEDGLLVRGLSHRIAGLIRREAKREAEAEAYRRRAVAEALEMLARSAPAAGSPVEAYLRLRRCHVPAALGALRFAADHPYRKDGKVHHRGPAMLAPVTDSRGRVTAAHQTWIDLSRPKGKAEIRHCETGEALKAKLVRGSKGDGAIRLVTAPSLARPGAELVIGEGIETVLSAAARGVPAGASFWASVDLGHLAGKAAYVDGRRRPDLPDLSDGDAFRAPRSLARLWLIRDGDSDPKATRAALLRGFARQAARIPGLEGRIVDPGDGRDLNDLALIGSADDAHRGAADRDDPREPPLRARGGLDGGEARP